MAPRIIKNDYIHPNNPLMLGNIMECVCSGFEQSADLLGCEATTSRKSQDVYSCLPALDCAMDFSSLDYAALHDQFLESLLREQRHKARQILTDDVSITPNVISDVTQLSVSRPPVEIITKVSKPKKQKITLSRRSPKRYSRQVMPLPLSHTAASLSPTALTIQNDFPVSMHDDSSTSKISYTHNEILSDPPSYLHENCRLQKDKQKGEPVGSEICAVGKASCLDKIRQKMQLLSDVADGKGGQVTRSKRKPTMKKRNAKITEATSTYTETRSVIELRMGFLSMQYGILLRWDIVNTGKIYIVVLRKMCSDSFYNSEQRIRSIPKPISTIEVAPFYWINNHAVWVRNDSAEVSLIDPPYQIPQTCQFPPAIMNIQAIQLIDFDTSCTWKMYFSVNGDVQKSVHRNGKQLATSDLVWSLPARTVESILELHLVEQRSSRHKRSRGTECLPLHFLQDQDDQKSVKTSYGTLNFQVIVESEYCKWLKQELVERGKFSVSIFPPSVDSMDRVIPERDDEVYWECCGLW
jgi:hypothetical protein